MDKLGARMRLGANTDIDAAPGRAAVALEGVRMGEM